MKKLILLVLVGSMLLLTLTGCLKGNNIAETTPHNTTQLETTTESIELKTPSNTPISIGELDNSSDLVVTLIAYLEQYLVEYDLVGRSFETKINNIKDGIQPLHVAFDPSNYYFVCGYYNSSSEYGDVGYHKSKEYTWVGYEKETEIQEYYNGAKWAVVFQINKALTITDIFSSEATVPNMEHFKIYKPTFENGVNVAAPVDFNETFIYLNYPNCYLNRFSQSTDVMYYSTSIYYHSMNTISCANFEGKYYLSFYLYTIYADGKRGEESNYVYTFGEYYDALMLIMEKDKYSITKDNGRTSFYGVISFEDFVNGILK